MHEDAGATPQASHCGVVVVVPCKGRRSRAGPARGSGARAPADLKVALQAGLRAALRPQEAEGPLAQARGQVAQRAQVPLPPGRARVQDVRQEGDQAARPPLSVSAPSVAGMGDLDSG